MPAPERTPEHVPEHVPGRDLPRTTLGVLFIGLLIVATLWILRPFLAPMIWAVMIVVSTWPMMTWLQARLWGKRALAVLVMSLLILTLLVVPLMLAIGTIVRHADDIVAQAAILSGYVMSPPPPWVAGLPLIGDNLARFWEQAAAAGSSGLVSRILPYADDIAKWFVSLTYGSFEAYFGRAFLKCIPLGRVPCHAVEKRSQHLQRLQPRRVHRLIDEQFHHHQLIDGITRNPLQQNLETFVETILRCTFDGESPFDGFATVQAIARE